jgi:hypothetical protein
LSRRLLCILAVLTLPACRLDVTQTIDVTAKGHEIITYSETFDDDALRVATQLGGPSAFGFDAAKQDGWDVRGSSAPNKHTFAFRHSFSGDGAEAALTRLAHDSTAATPDDAFLIGPTAFVGLPITGAAPTASSLSVPALLRPSETVGSNGRKDPAFQLANARVNAAAVNSVVHVRIELRDALGVHQVAPDFAEPTALSPSSGFTVHVGHLWPLSRILAFWRSVGPYGVFDYEHYSPPLCSAQATYRKAWMFGVGVYANGANIPKQLMTSAGTLAQRWLAAHPVKCP